MSGLILLFGARFLSDLATLLSAEMALRISLPVRFGGFGLRPVVRVSPIAYACSLASAASNIAQLRASGSRLPLLRSSRRH